MQLPGVSSKVDDILERYPSRHDALIMILQDIQHTFNYLPAEALKKVAKALSLPLSSIYSVATFYKAFSLVPQGRTVIHVCQGTACHVRGAKYILDTLSQALSISPGQTTPDGAFTLKTVNCVGACSMAPVVIVGGKYHANMTPSDARKLLEVPCETR